MELSKAYQLTRSLMDQHGLTQWKLEWMHLKTTAGLCYNSKLTWHKDPSRSRGKIEISTHFFGAWSEAEVRETALHEIAHALVPPGEHHGPVWKAMAKKIGSTGERCVSAEEGAKVQSRYKGQCPQGHTFKRHKKTWNMEVSNLGCPECNKKKLPSVIVWTDTYTGRVVNPQAAPKKEAPVAPPVVKVAAQTTRKLPKVVKSPSWKERFDKGDTSFADVW